MSYARNMNPQMTSNRYSGVDAYGARYPSIETMSGGSNPDGGNPDERNAETSCWAPIGAVQGIQRHSPE